MMKNILLLIAAMISSITIAQSIEIVSQPITFATTGTAYAPSEGQPPYIMRFKGYNITPVSGTGEIFVPIKTASAMQNDVSTATLSSTGDQTNKNGAAQAGNSGAGYGTASGVHGATLGNATASASNPRLLNYTDNGDGTYDVDVVINHWSNAQTIPNGAVVAPTARFFSDGTKIGIPVIEDTNNAGTYVVAGATFDNTATADTGANLLTKAAAILTDLDDTEDLILNSGFDNSNINWYGNHGVIEVRTENGNSFFFANVAVAGDPHDVNLQQKVDLIQGVEYTLTFEASSDQERTIVPGIGKIGGDWFSVSESVTITTTSQPFELDFVANFDGGTEERVFFDLGADAGTVVIDNVTLKVKPVDNTVATPDVSNVVLQEFSELLNSANAEVFGGFGDGLTATNELVDGPIDATNKVRKYVTTAGGNDWKGVFIRPQTHYIDLTTSKKVSIDLYSTTATYVKGIIQQGQSEQNTIVLGSSTAHSGSGWETLTFDFANATGEWGEFALRVAVNATGAGDTSQALTVHVDNLLADQGSVIPAPPSGPTDSPAAPTKDAADVISIYSDAYTDIATDYNPAWEQAGSVNTTYDPGDGNNVLVYTNFNYQGTFLQETDASNMDYLHIDIWVAENNRTVKVSPIGAGETLTAIEVTPGSWNSVDIPVTSFSAVNFSAISQLKFDGQFQTDGATADVAVRSDIYLDNIYLWNDTSNDGNTGGGNTGATGDVIFDFEEATQIDSWDKVADAATRTSEVVFEHVTTGGNPDGAFKFGGTNADGAGGRNYSFAYEDANFDYSTAATARITFDLLQSSAALPGTAIHFRYETPGGGAQFVGAIQSNGLNGSTWTAYQYDATVSGTSTGIFKITYEFAAGATQGDGGEVLLDNVAVTLLDSNGNTLGVVALTESSFSVYPNPVQNTLNVSAGVSVDQISIFDLTGREVLRAAPNASAFSLDVANLNKGLYLVSLKAGDKEITTKLVK